MKIYFCEWIDVEWVLEYWDFTFCFFLRPQLTACVHGSAAMLCPMHWQHVYIPVLPQHLLDYCWCVFQPFTLLFSSLKTPESTHTVIRCNIPNIFWVIMDHFVLFSLSAPMPYLIGVHSSLMEVSFYNFEAHKKKRYLSFKCKILLLILPAFILRSSVVLRFVLKLIVIKKLLFFACRKFEVWLWMMW